MERILVLASSSPSRRELLDRLGMPYVVSVPGIDETRAANESPTEYVRRLSREKAEAVAQNFPDALIIGSDQAAVLDGRVIGKPGDHEKATAQLRAGSGRTVEFLTGVCLLDSASGQAETRVVPFRVVFRELDDGAIERYLRHEQPYGCAGSFKSEGLGISLFERLEGEDPTALVGLPLITLVTLLREAGMAIP